MILLFCFSSDVRVMWVMNQMEQLGTLGRMYMYNVCIFTYMVCTPWEGVHCEHFDT